MFRALAPKALKSRIADTFDSLRFLSKAERRRLYLGTAITSTLLTSGTYLSLHTVYLESVMGQLQMYKNKYAYPVDSSLVALLQTVLDDLSVPGNSTVGVFNFVGNEPYSLGSLRLPSGGYIGLPFNFTFTNVSQVKVENLRLLLKYRTKRSGNAPVIKALTEAMILSQDAKKYAIAHEVSFLSSPFLALKTLNLALWTGATFALVPALNRTFGFTGKADRRLHRVCVGILGFLLITVFTAAVVDQALDELFDLSAVRRTLAQGDTSYSSGAVEYYTKLIARNRALYELLGDYGPTYYGVEGQTVRLFGLRKQSYETHLALASNANEKKQGK